MDLKTALKSKLTKKELELLRTSFDTIGSVAVLEIPDELKRKEKLIAQTLLKLNKNIKTVCKKTSDRVGKYRLRKLKKLAGDGFETIHMEYGCRYKLDPRKTYFSPRESTERFNIAKKIKPKERVLVMFSGVGPFGILIAKQQPGAKIICVEMNPDAVEYANENIKLNSVQSKIENICGNVKKICPKLDKFDRIIAPLPETAYKYLGVMFSCCKKSGTIYLYGIAEEKNGKINYSNLVDEIKKTAKKSRKKIRVLRKRKVLPYKPRTFKVCVEVKII